MSSSGRRRGRKLSLSRLLQVALPLALLLGAGFVALQFLWLNSGPWGVPHKSYQEFEQDVLDQKVKRATIDGNIIRAYYDGNLLAVVLTPSVQRSVDVLMKKGVQVEPSYALPASGLSLPVLALALLPYPILAYFALGLMQALGTGADFRETEEVVEKMASALPEPQAPLPSALEDSIEGRD